MRTRREEGLSPLYIHRGIDLVASRHEVVLHGEQDGLFIVDEELPETTVVLFTAYGGPEIEHEARRRGAVFLEKPLPLPAIGMVIDRLQSSTEQATSE